MAYVTAALIGAEFKDMTFSATTAITSDDVAEFITQEEALLDGQIGTVYSVPIVSGTSPLSFSIMRLLATLLVRDRIEAILAVKTGGRTPDQGDETGTPWATKAKEIIEKILKNEMILPDATLLNSTGGVQSYSSVNEIEPIFEKETVQW